MTMQIIQTQVLVCTIEVFSRQSGVEEGVILGWIKKGYLPTRKIGKRSLINLAQFNIELLENDENGE